MWCDPLPDAIGHQPAGMLPSASAMNLNGGMSRKASTRSNRSDVPVVRPPGGSPVPGGGVRKMMAPYADNSTGGPGGPSQPSPQAYQQQQQAQPYFGSPQPMSPVGIPMSFPSPPQSPGRITSPSPRNQQPSSLAYSAPRQRSDSQVSNRQRSDSQLSNPGGPPQPEIVIRLDEFHARFVRPHLPKAAQQQLAAQGWRMTPSEQLQGAIGFVSSVRLTQRDFRIVDDPQSLNSMVKLCIVSHRGMRVLENFAQMKKVGNAAIDIQRVWRGHRDRKVVRAMPKEGSLVRAASLKTPVVPVVRKTSGTKLSPGNPIARFNNRGSIIVDETELKRVSIASMSGFAYGSGDVPSSKRSSRSSHSHSQLAMHHPETMQVMSANQSASEEANPSLPFSTPQIALTAPPQPTAADPEKEERDRERADRRRSKVVTFKRHLLNISQIYQDIVMGGGDSAPQEDGATGAPSTKEVQFMRLLNSDDTFRLSNNLRAVHKLERSATIEEAQAHYEEQGGVPGGRTPAQMYTEYAARVVEWIAAVLPHVPIPAGADLVAILRSGDTLCELAVAIYPKVQCQLLQKGPEFTIHKIIFFLELCKTIGIKPSMLFSVSDLLLGGVEHDPVRKSALTVLRTVCALERQARRRGWSGPPMVLKPEGPAFGRKRSSSSGQRNSTMDLLERDGLVSPTAGGPHPNLSNPRRVSTASNPNRRSKTPPSRRLSTTSKSSQQGTAVSSSGNPRRSSKRYSASSSGHGPDSSAGDGMVSLAPPAPPLVPAANPASPSELSSLSREERSNRLSIMTTKTARESLYNYYAAVGEVAVDRSEYDELMGALLAREKLESEAEKEAEARRREEEEVKTKEAKAREEMERKQAEVRRMLAEGMKKRNRAVKEFLVAEETHLHNLTTVSDHLSQLLYRRRRQSKRHSRGLPPLGSSTDSPVPAASDLSIVDPYAPQPGESPTRAQLRVEGENEDLTLLDRVLSDLVSLHSTLCSDLHSALDPDPEHDEDEGWDGRTCGGVGHAAARFAGDAQGILAPYAVVALGGLNGSGVGVGLEGVAAMTDLAEWDERVVRKYMGEVYKRPEGVQAVEAKEWAWYLGRAIRRLTEYEGVLREIVESWCAEEKELGSGKGSGVELEMRRVRRDDRRVQVAIVKLGCTATTIVGNLGLTV
ncbi:hypothetical protein HK101_001990 [Irineochytrium annulatum]|nr:hypothetical protein HK101_001990 [Irineochytrium annulatum]